MYREDKLDDVQTAFAGCMFSRLYVLVLYTSFVLSPVETLSSKQLSWGLTESCQSLSGPCRRQRREAIGIFGKQGVGDFRLCRRRPLSEIPFGKEYFMSV